MRVPNMINTAVWSGTVAAAMVAVTVAFGGTAHASAPIDHPGCVAAPYAGPGSDQGYYCDQYAVEPSGSNDRVADCLVALGYHGRTDDHAEIIYSTASDIEWCASDPAGMWVYAGPVESTTV